MNKNAVSTERRKKVRRMYSRCLLVCCSLLISSCETPQEERERLAAGNDEYQQTVDILLARLEGTRAPGSSQRETGSVRATAPSQTNVKPNISVRSGGDERSPIDIFKESAESVAMIVNMDSNGKVQSLGSGFFAFDGIHIVTNFHVINNASYIFVKIGEQEPFEVTEVFALDKARDLAILTSDTVGKPLNLSHTAPQVGEQLFAIGNPHGLENTLSEGILSGVREIDGATLYQISAPISPGSSGGPVIGSDGSVFGVSTFTTEGQNLNFAVPASYIEELWERPTRIPVGDSRLRSVKPVATRPEREAEKTAQLEIVGLRKGEEWAGSQILDGSVVNRSQRPVSNIKLRAKWWSKADPNTILHSNDDEIASFKSLEPGLGEVFRIICGDIVARCDGSWQYSVEITGYDLK
jgi:serine protease Do